MNRCGWKCKVRNRTGFNKQHTRYEIWLSKLALRIDFSTCYHVGREFAPGHRRRSSKLLTLHVTTDPTQSLPIVSRNSDNIARKVLASLPLHQHRDPIAYDPFLWASRVRSHLRVFFLWKIVENRVWKQRVWQVAAS